MKIREKSVVFPRLKVNRSELKREKPIMFLIVHCIVTGLIERFLQRQKMATKEVNRKLLLETEA